MTSSASKLDSPVAASESALGQVSMTCANFGNGPILRDALDDWYRFCGGRPADVCIVDGGSDSKTQQVCWELLREGKLDKVQFLRSEHYENHKDKCYYQEHQAGVIATQPYILWFKFDTLPYRLGHDNWLVEAIGYLERPDVFAVGGSFNVDSFHHEAWPGWYFSDKCSINFSLMKRDTFIDALQEFAGPYIASGFRTVSPAAATGQTRFLMETAMENYIRRHQKYTLVKREAEDWTIFHTNCVGDRLVKARADFFARKNVMKYADAGSGRFGTQAKYYGQPPVPMMTRARIAFGKSAAGPLWRRIKGRLRGRPA